MYENHANNLFMKFLPNHNFESGNWIIFHSRIATGKQMRRFKFSFQRALEVWLFNMELDSLCFMLRIEFS